MAILDGKALAAATKAEAAQKVQALREKGIVPCLAVVLVGENPASQVYVRGKVNDCAECGIESRSIRMAETSTQDEVLAQVRALAADASVHGILVQLPLPAQISEKAVIDAIPPEKDVDGFSPVNVVCVNSNKNLRSTQKRAVNGILSQTPLSALCTKIFI